MDLNAQCKAKTKFKNLGFFFLLYLSGKMDYLLDHRNFHIFVFLLVICKTS